MPTIEFLPADKRVEATHGTPLVTVARQAGVEIDLPCGGDGSCGRCVVRTKGGGVETASLEDPIGGGRIGVCPGVPDADPG